jgi:integrase
MKRDYNQSCLPFIGRRPARRSRGRDVWPLAAPVLAELDAYESRLLRRGQVAADSAQVYRQALACVAKQGQRHLGKTIATVWEVYSADTIAAIARDDSPFDPQSDQLRKYTLRQRRVAIRSFARTMADLDPEGRALDELDCLVDEGLRKAGAWRGMRATIDAGAKHRRHRRPTEEELEKVAAVAGGSRTTFLGRRNRAALYFMARVGARSMTLLAMDGSDFQWRRGKLFARIREKGRRGRRPIEVPADIVPLLRAYIDSFNGQALARGWGCEIGPGVKGPLIGFAVKGPFWRGPGGKPLTYHALLGMARTSASIAGVPDFHLHGLRHMRAGYLGKHLDSDEAALAGGWRGPGVYERHYASAVRSFGPEEPAREPPSGPDEAWPGADDGTSTSADQARAER